MWGSLRLAPIKRPLKMASPSGSGQPSSSEDPNPGCHIDETPREQKLQQKVVNSGERGGYDCEFIERPKELQTDCPICLIVLREPFQVTCCGYSFCQTCVKRIQADKKACPTCNEAKFDAFPNKGLRRSLYAFRVCCVHQKSGCEWTGELVGLDRHLNLNPELGKQLIGCVFAAVACTHCCEYFQRRYVNAHQTDSCPQRPFSCDYCDDYGSVYEDVINNHWPVCKCYPVPCPNKCGVNPERQNIEAHVNTQCPLTVVNCDFHYTGCEVQLARRDMPTHLAESLTAHISLLTAQTQTMAGSGAQGHLAEHLLPHLSLLALHNQQLTQLTIQLKQSLEESQRKIQELEREKQAQAAELEDISEMSKCKIVTLEREKEAQAILIADLQKASDTSGRKIEVLEKEKQAQAAVNAEFQKTSDTSQHKIQVLEKEKQTQVAVIAEFRKMSDINRCKIEQLEKERQAQTALNAEFRKTSNTSQRKIEVLEMEKQAQATVIAELQKTSNTNRYKAEVLQNERQAQTALNAEFRKTSDTSRCKIEELEKKQAAVNAELQRDSETSKREIHKLKQENEVLKREVNEVVKEEIAQLRKETEEEIKPLQTSLQVAMAESESLKQETTELRRKQEEDRASLATVQQCIGMFPPHTKLTMTNFEEMKRSNGQWYSPPFYTHPQGYKMCLKVYANGNVDGEGTHVSVYAYLMRGEFDDHLKWPFRGRVVIQLCNQLQDKYHHGYTIDFSGTTDAKVISQVSTGDRAESGRGSPTFIPHNDLNFNPTNNCQYLKNDSLHFQIVAVESLSEPGVLPTELTMTDFEQHKIDRDNWFSPPFYTHPQGYKMCLRADANGDGDGVGTHVSVYAYLMRGQFDHYLKWPFRGHVTVAMLNQLEDRNHTTKTIEFTNFKKSKYIGRVMERERAPSGLGYQSFLAHTELNYNPTKNCQYLKYDCLRFQIVKVELK